MATENLQSYETEILFSHPTRILIRQPSQKRQEPLPIFLALHGYGTAAKDILDTLSALDLSGFILVAPDGPYPLPPPRRGPPKAGYSWYVYHQNDPDSFHAELRRIEEHLVSVLDQVEARYQVDRKRSVLLGFSQGGYVAGYVGIRQAQRFGGLVLASARLKHEILTRELAAGSLPRTLVIHCPDDSLVRWPPQEDSVTRLQAAGGQVTVFHHSAGHQLPPEAISHLGRWLCSNNLVAS